MLYGECLLDKIESVRLNLSIVGFSKYQGPYWHITMKQYRSKSDRRFALTTSIRTESTYIPEQQHSVN